MHEDLGIDTGVLARLQAQAQAGKPSEVLRLLMQLVPETDSFGVVRHFKAIYPSVPLRVCIDAQAPARLCDDGLSDEEFDALFAPWLDR